MQSHLDQGAIDKLFAAQTAAIPLPDAEPAATDLYNFSRAGQISNEQMRAITMVNDHFARNLMHTLGAWLRTQTQAMLVAGEQMPYGEFLARIPEPSYVCLLRLEPLGGAGLLELDLTVAMTMIDLLLGGLGQVGEARELTEIEKAILLSVIEVVVRELNQAWQSVGLQFEFERPEDEGAVARLMPSVERTLCVSFEMDVLGVKGMLNFCLPAVVLNTIHRRLIAVGEKARPKFEVTTRRVATLTSLARLPVTLRLPPVKIASRDVRAMKAGTLMELPLPRTVAAELLVGGMRVCSAVPVERCGMRGAQLLESAPVVGVRSDAVAGEDEGEA